MKVKMSVAPPEQQGFFSGLWTKAKDVIAGTTEAVVSPFRSALPAAASDAQVAGALGVRPEVGGRTMTGGKRYRKTRRAGKKHRKTGKRKH